MTEMLQLGSARSWTEVRRYFQFQGCPKCGERSIGWPDSDSFLLAPDHVDAGIIRITCPECGTRRAGLFVEEAGFPRNADRAFHLGPDYPSKLITPYQFAKDLVRALELVETDASRYAAVSKDEWRANSQACADAQEAVNELLKFIPEDATELPESFMTDSAAWEFWNERRELFSRSYLEGMRASLASTRELLMTGQAERIARTGPPPVGPLPLPPFSPSATDFHERWVMQGVNADAQQMTGRGVDAQKRNFNRRQLSRVEAENSTLSEGSFVRTYLDGAKFIHVDFSGSNFTMASVAGALFERCDLSNTTWTGCDVSKATFVDCKLDGATDFSTR